MYIYYNIYLFSRNCVGIFYCVVTDKINIVATCLNTTNEIDIFHCNIIQCFPRIVKSKKHFFKRYSVYTHMRSLTKEDAKFQKKKFNKKIR